MLRRRGEAAHSRVRHLLKRSPEVAPTIDDFADVANLITWARQLEGEALEALRKLGAETDRHEAAGHYVPTVEAIADTLGMDPIDLAFAVYPTDPTQGDPQ